MTCEIKGNTQEIDRFDSKIKEDLVKGEEIGQQMQKLNNILSVTKERLERMLSRSILQEVVEAEQNTSLVNTSASSNSRNETIAETIRRKSSNQRTLEEMRWIALDILVNKDSTAYMDMSVEEREELQLNDEYRAELQAEDVVMILKLPREIQLALPYMRSPAEIDAHNLLTTYTHGWGDAEFARADEDSQDNCLVVFSEEDKSSKEWGKLVPKATMTHSAPTDDLKTIPSKSPCESKPQGPSTKQQQETNRREYGLQEQAGMVATVCGMATSATKVDHVTKVDQVIKVDQVTPEQEGKEKEMIMFDSMSDVAMRGIHSTDQEIAVRVGEKELYNSTGSLLKMQETQVFRFSVVDTPPTYSVNIKVTISFKGCLGATGFSGGRVGAILRRIPKSAEGCPSSPAESIGYAPHSFQKLNLGNQFHQTPGTIFIQHCPRRVPLAGFVYEVEVTALSLTKYSLVVLAGQAELCTSLVGKRMEETKKVMVRLDELGNYLAFNWEAARLRERQYHVCTALIEEAASECLRCEEGIDDLCGYLRPRDKSADIVVNSSQSTISSKKSNRDSDETSRTATSSSTSSTYPNTTATTTEKTTCSSSAGSSLKLYRCSSLTEKEREETWKEIAAIETEYMHWGRLLTTRCQEKASVKKSIQGLIKLRRNCKVEEEHLEAMLKQAVAEIPIIVSIVNGFSEAAQVSKEISKRPRSGQKCQAEWSPAMTSPQTPASKTRNTFERYGWKALDLEERQWVTLDQVMNPDQYTCLYDVSPIQQEEAKRKVGQRGKLRSAPRKNPAVERCRFERGELMRILAEPFQDLNRREKYVRKLLSKFHDNRDLVKTESSLSGQLEKHDANLAKRVRQTSEKDRTKIEKEWVLLDKILNPQIWNRAKQGLPGAHIDQRPSDVRGGCMKARFDQEQDTWTCPFSRAQLLRIWASSGEVSLTTDDEKRVFRLLTTFNGAYQGQNSDRVEDGVEDDVRGVRMDELPSGSYIDINIDQRLRCLQQELERISNNTNNPSMKSCVLHGAPQQYPTSTLRLEVEAEIDLLLRYEVQQRERKNIYLIEDISSSSSDEETMHDQFQKKQENRRKRRLKQRSNRAGSNIYAARKRLLLDSRKTLLQEEYTKRIAKLGSDGCSACMTTPCKQVPVIDVEGANSRLARIADELHFARTSLKDELESLLPLSVQRNGVTTFRRTDLIDELTWEQSHLRHMLKLHLIDQEFHDASKTSQEHIECVALHGYRMLMWTKDARVALEREHDRLVARLVASETIHDILACMLEGWYFGERQSRYAAVGCVPSIKKTGFIKAGKDAKMRVEPCPKEVKVRREDRHTSLTLPPEIDGSRWSKSDELVVKAGGVHDEEINSSEISLRFGLVCVTIMFFRARWLLRQKREGEKQMKLGWVIDTSVPVRAKRSQNFPQIGTTSTQAGHQRVKVRKEREQAKVMADFAGFLAVKGREVGAAQLLQRVYRGHISRKASHRWRAKRAEYKAMNALLVSTALTIQRVARGGAGRRRARVIRANIARWLGYMIDDETREFETQLLSKNETT